MDACSALQKRNEQLENNKNKTSGLQIFFLFFVLVFFDDYGGEDEEDDDLQIYVTKNSI